MRTLKALAGIAVAGLLILVFAPTSALAQQKTGITKKAKNTPWTQGTFAYRFITTESYTASDCPDGGTTCGQDYTTDLRVQSVGGFIVQRPGSGDKKTRAKGIKSDDANVKAASPTND